MEEAMPDGPVRGGSTRFRNSSQLRKKSSRSNHAINRLLKTDLSHLRVADVDRATCTNERTERIAHSRTRSRASGERVHQLVKGRVRWADPSQHECSKVDQ